MWKKSWIVIRSTSTAPAAAQAGRLMITPSNLWKPRGWGRGNKTIVILSEATKLRSRRTSDFLKLEVLRLRNFVASLRMTMVLFPRPHPRGFHKLLGVIINLPACAAAGAVDVERMTIHDFFHMRWRERDFVFH